MSFVPLPVALVKLLLPANSSVRLCTGHTMWVSALVVTSDGRHIISASADKTVRVWSLQSGAEVSFAFLWATGHVGARLAACNAVALGCQGCAPGNTNANCLPDAAVSVKRWGRAVATVVE